MACAYLSIGANLEKRKSTCLKAVRCLHALENTRVVSASGLYETQPEDLLDQPVFINMALVLRTELSPVDLLTACQRIETDLGRKPSLRFGPRTIDIDLLMVDQLQFTMEGLEIPHPRMHQRRFVLEPLAEIAPDARHPGMGRSISEMLNDLNAEGNWVRKIASP
jgi:2-amino-4-hydroxy-6-hydroxymethyldihydropteridine diphosphokinase